MTMITVIDCCSQSSKLVISIDWEVCTRPAKYLDFIDIYLPLDDNEQERYQRDYQQEAKTVATFSERYYEKGKEQGMQVGLQRGEFTLLKRLLGKRFGELDNALIQRLEQASTDELERWADRVLEANSLEEVFH